MRELEIMRYLMSKEYGSLKLNTTWKLESQRKEDSDIAVTGTNILSQQQKTQSEIISQIQ